MNRPLLYVAALLPPLYVLALGPLAFLFLSGVISHDTYSTVASFFSPVEEYMLTGNDPFCDALGQWQVWCEGLAV